jgi:hypothetical protein
MSIIKMKPPKEPIKPYPPYKPQPPSKIIPADTHLATIDLAKDYSYSLTDWQEMTQFSGVKSENIRFSFEVEQEPYYYDEILTHLKLYIRSTEEIDNPKYDEQYKHYLKQLEKYKAEYDVYKAAKKQYKIDYAAYEIENDKYQLEYRKLEVERLKKRLKKMKGAIK